MKNTERRSANVCLALMSSGLVALILPSALDANMMQWGYAVSFVGGFVAFSFLLCFFLFNGRAKVMDRIFNNQRVLAHWKYDEASWGRMTTQDRGNTVLFKIFGLLLAVVFLLIGIVGYLSGMADGAPFAGSMGGVAVVFIIVGIVSSRSGKKRVDTSSPEAIISQDGLYYKNILYTWNTKRLADLQSVDRDPEDASALLFSMKQLQGGGKFNIARHQSFAVSIPIPPGEEEKADEIIRHFGLPLS